MDKGQHLRLVILEGSGTPTNKFIALSDSMTLHLSAQTEDSTTKDSSDTSGNWNEYDVTGRSGDIQFSALVGVGTDSTGLSFADMLGKVDDSLINWKVCTVNSTNNRTIVKTVCSGQGKLSGVKADAPNRQKTTYSGTINIYGPVTVGTD